MSTSIVHHQGIVQNVKNNQLEIMIVSESACYSCRSKKVCSISEIKEKLIYITSFDESYRIGEEVIVFLEEKMGTFAVLLAYGLPFVIMISILFIGHYIKLSEPLMGLSVILSLALYFVILYLFRNQFSKKVSFKVEKQSNQAIKQEEVEIL